MLYQVGVMHGRWDNIYIEADSPDDILYFFNTFTNADVKEIYEVSHTAQVEASAPSSADYEVKAFVNTNPNEESTIISFRNTKKSLTKQKLINELRYCYLLMNKPIRNMITVMKKEK